MNAIGPLTLRDLTSALATYGIGAPEVFSSTDTATLLVGTYYGPSGKGRWVFQATRRDSGGIQIVPLHPLKDR